MQNKIKPFLCIYLFLTICISCNNKSGKSNLPDINIGDETYVENIELDNYIDSIFFVEAQENIPFITEISKLVFTDNQIIIKEESTLENKAIFGIDFSGKLKNMYGSVGQGPDEYISSFDLACEGNSLYIYDRHRKHILKYNLESGKLIDKIKLNFHFTHFTFIDSNKLAISADEEDGSEFILYDLDKLGKVFGKYKYREGYNIDIPKVFAKKQNETYYLHPACDTIFIVQNTELKPLFTISYQNGGVDNEFREMERFESKKRYLEKKSLSLTTEIFAGNDYFMFRYLNGKELRTFLAHKNKKIIFHGCRFLYKNHSIPNPVALWKDYLVFYIVPEIYKLEGVPKNENFILMFARIKQ